MKRLVIVVALLVVLVGAFILTSTSAEKKENANNPVVVMETSMGIIKIELNQEKAPVTVKNFLGYVDDHFYDGTIFHRIIPDFMVQGGGFEPGMKEKQAKAAIKNESTNGLSNTRGTIAMARTGDPNSATAQFYINAVDNSSKLDRTDSSAGYCVFGKVIDGMDVVDKIRQVETGSKEGFDDVPAKDVLIKSVRRAEK